MGTFVEVPKEAITSCLEKAGFKREPVRGEITYSRLHNKDNRFVVIVYTSVAETGTKGRGCGEDAIRVVALFRWTRKGETEVRRKKLFQGRVFRVTSVEGVLSRMMEKARDAYRACNDFIDEDKRRRSGAPDPLSGAEWRAAAQKHAKDLELPAGEDLWDEADRYDLQKEGKKAFERGEDPKAFIERMFAEELARMEEEDAAREQDQDDYEKSVERDAELEG